MHTSTRHRDLKEKRSFYMEAGIPDYWIVDADSRTIISVGPRRPDLVVGDILSWHPPGATHALVIDIREYFRAAVG